MPVCWDYRERSRAGRGSQLFAISFLAQPVRRLPHPCAFLQKRSTSLLMFGRSVVVIPKFGLAKGRPARLCSQPAHREQLSSRIVRSFEFGGRVMVRNPPKALLL